MNNINSAYQAAMAEQENKEKEAKKILDEYNNPTNNNLKRLIEQNQQQIKLLESQKDQLNKQLELALRNEKEARKEAKQSKVTSYIAIAIALLSLIATIVIAIIK